MPDKSMSCLVLPLEIASPMYPMSFRCRNAIVPREFLNGKLAFCVLALYKAHCCLRTLS